MMSEMPGTFVRQQLTAALVRLALPASAQASYLERLGTAPLADELALEFGDFVPMLPKAVRDGAISESQAEAIRDVSGYIESFSTSENAGLWEISGLYTAPQWDELRRLAAIALRELERPT